MSVTTAPRRQAVSSLLPLAAGLVLAGLALFRGGAITDSPVMWLGGSAIAAILLALALLGPPARLGVVAPLWALAAWFAVSIVWSTLPDRSWAYADRAALYALYATLGLWLASHTRALAVGLAALFAAVASWALLGKVFPPLAGAASSVARLSAPIGLWNQLALVGAFALPLALWLARERRSLGTLLAYLWLVALVLTVSRAGIVVAALALAAFLARCGEAADCAWTLLAAGMPGVTVAGIAFALPAVTATGASDASRWREGLLFGGLLVAGGACAALGARVPRPLLGPRLRRAAIALGVVLAAAAIAAAALKARSEWDAFTSPVAVSNSVGRLTSASSNFRWAWWTRAWKAFTLHPLGGTGAGSFELTNLLYRTSALDYTTEPHELPLQLLSETGIVGLGIAVCAFAALLVAAGRRRGHELALSLLLPAYLLHALVDIDWDFVAVSAPAFLAAGALAGRARRSRKPLALPGVLMVSGAGVALFAALFLPWIANRWSFEALSERPAQAIATAKLAHDADPYLLQPLWTEADAYYGEGTAQGYLAALALYREATRIQPASYLAWLYLGRAEFDIGCERLAYPALQTFTNLDDHPDGELSFAVELKNAALAFVDAGKHDPPSCASYGA